MINAAGEDLKNLEDQVKAREQPTTSSNEIANQSTSKMHKNPRGGKPQSLEEYEKLLGGLSKGKRGRPKKPQKTGHNLF